MELNHNCLYIMMGYNSPEVTGKAVTELKKYTSKKNILLIDNGSKNSLEPIAQKVGVLYFKHIKNLGFSEGYNTWLKKHLDGITQEYICLINNDVFVNAIMMTELPKRMKQWSINKKLAAIQPVLYLDSDLTKVENAGVRYYPTAMAFQNKDPNRTNDVLLNGACLYLKTLVVKELFAVYGYLLNPLFFFNAEDVELSLRIKSRGYTLLVDTNLKAQHAQSSTVGAKSEFGYKMSVRNLLWTALISRSTTELVVTFPFILLGQIVLALLAIKQNMTKSVFFSLLQTQKHIHDIKQYRYQFQNNRISN